MIKPLLGLALATLLGAAPVAACTCTGAGYAVDADNFDGPDRFLALVLGHDEVFAGRVVERIPFEGDAFGEGAARYVFEVGRRWRGAEADRVIIENDGSTCSYAPKFDTGIDFLVFARRDAEGGLRTELCLTAPPARLGYVTDGWAAGLTDEWEELLSARRYGDAFAALDHAAERFRRMPELETFSPMEGVSNSGPHTTVRVVVTDRLTGSPASAVAGEGGTSELVVEPRAFVEGRAEAGGLAVYTLTLPLGPHAISTRHGERSAVTHIIATGGERVVHLRLALPFPE